tara:strand:+ start:231 stop:434 length:204 start_codon:yes stop_codon:yes gene_type:complete
VEKEEDQMHPFLPPETATTHNVATAAMAFHPPPRLPTRSPTASIPVAATIQDVIKKIYYERKREKKV